MISFCSIQDSTNKVTLENDGAFDSAPDQYKNERMCHKAVYNYGHALEFVPDYYKTQEKNKAVSTYPFALECYKTQEMCDKAVNTFFIIHTFFIIYILFCY